MIRLFFTLPLLLSLTACFNLIQTKSVEANDICIVLNNHNDWYQSLVQVEKKWDIKKDLILAFIHQESRFKSDARPHKDAHVANNTPSNAYGFAQVKDETWEWYQFRTQNYNVERDNFDHAVNFMGWYMNESTDRLKISKRDVIRQYLAYHEGQGGFERKTFMKKPWLIEVAKKVARKAKIYKKQLKQCETKLAKAKKWDFF